MRSILSVTFVSDSSCADVRSEPFSVQVVLQSLPEGITLNGIAMKVKGSSEQTRVSATLQHYPLTLIIRTGCLCKRIYKHPLRSRQSF